MLFKYSSTIQEERKTINSICKSIIALAKPGTVLPPPKSVFWDISQTPERILSRSRKGPRAYVKVVKQRPLKPGTCFARIAQSGSLTLCVLQVGCRESCLWVEPRGGNL